jgi:MOSC domain-containing protein YiiM
MPRLPCIKFSHKVGRPQILKEFLQGGFSGFYMRVLNEGEVGAGDDITMLERDPAGVTVRMALGLQKLQEGGADELRRALTIPSLAPLLRDDLQKRLAKLA